MSGEKNNPPDEMIKKAVGRIKESLAPAFSKPITNFIEWGVQDLKQYYERRIDALESQIKEKENE